MHLKQQFSPCVAPVVNTILHDVPLQLYYVMMLNHILSETAVYHHCHQGLMKPLQHSCAQSAHILPCPHAVHQRQAHGNCIHIGMPHVKHLTRASRVKHSMQSSTAGVSGAGMPSMSMSEVSPPSNTTAGGSSAVTMSTDSITRARTPGYKKKGAIHLKPNSYDTEDRQAGRQMVMVMMVMMVIL